MIAAATSWPGGLHVWDVYHYYVGGKYLPELGYQRLYTCTVVADSENQSARAGLRYRIRDLATGKLTTAAGAALDHDACKKRFSDARWQAFRRDVAWFRGRVSESRWIAMQQDHGFNGTPVWALLGRMLAETAPASDLQIRALSLIDPVLLAAMWALVTWAFGWRVACVAIIFWATCHLSDAAWTGGAYLRYDWLVAAVGGICLLRRQRPFAAGFFLAYAALLRIFPVFIILGLLLSAAITAYRRRELKLAGEHRRVVVGVAASILLLVPASLLVAGNEAWPGFVRKARTHLDTPLTNNVGLSVAVAYEDATRAEFTASLNLDVDPFEPWREMRRRTLEERRHVFVGLLGVFTLLFAVAIRGQPSWVVAILSVGMLPVALALSNYYYAILLVFALLSVRHIEIGIALCALAIATRIIGALTKWNDVMYAADSVAVLLLVLFVFVRYAVASAPCNEASNALRPRPRAISS